MMTVKAAAGRLAAAVLTLAGLGCAAGGGSTLPAHLALSRPQLLSVEARISEKAVSGPPEALVVTWTRSADPDAQGYYLYRDTQNIADPGPDGLLDPSLRVNEGNMIGQPGSGSEVVFVDDFGAEKPQIGLTYYYRVTVVDSNDDESYPSNQMTWTVHGHNISGLDPGAAYWGETVTIQGDTFGAYDAGTDSVLFLTVDGQTEGTVTNWTDTAIEVTVPSGAITGKVRVIIEATVAESNDPLVILNPYILSLDPPIGFVEQGLTINGANFGATQGASTVSLAGNDVSGQVTAWQADTIVLTVPASAVKGDVLVTVASVEGNSAEFTPRAEILSVDMLGAQAGEDLTLSGRFFGTTEGTLELADGTAQTVLSWSDTSISFTLTGLAGPQFLVVNTAELIPSNDFAYDITEPLSVTLSGLETDIYYTPSNVPAVGVDTAADADRVELRIDGLVVATSDTAPFDDLVLPVADLTNGDHIVDLIATRRSISVTSASVTVMVYSLVGDINADGLVDLGDRDALSLLVGLDAGSPAFKPWFDTDVDGLVTEADLAAVGYYFGATN